VTEQELRLKRFLDACAVRCLPVLTKIDKVARCEWKPRMRAVAEALLLADPGAVIPFSAATGEGREALLAAIQSCMGGSRATPVRR
jgi:GTP-binding protein